jgi:hypothetical protein
MSASADNIVRQRTVSGTDKGGESISDWLHFRNNAGDGAPQESIRQSSETSLRFAAIILSVISLTWSVAEGAVSVLWAEETESLGLLFYGIDGFVEATAACLILWRFLRPLLRQSGETDASAIRQERVICLLISSLQVLLGLGAICGGSANLILGTVPASPEAGLIISAATMTFVGGLWFCKRTLAIRLNSRALASEARCSLACLKLSAVLMGGSLLYLAWPAAWWVDAAMAVLLGLMFLMEGAKGIKYANSAKFDGGCCEADECK